MLVQAREAFLRGDLEVGRAKLVAARDSAMADMRERFGLSPTAEIEGAHWPRTTNPVDRIKGDDR
jgi:hypothetical protein